MATAIPDIGPLVSLVGSVGFSVLGLIVPVIMETVWYWYPIEDDDGGEEQNRWNGDLTTAENNNGAKTNGFGSAQKASNRRFIRRAIRHVKNIALFILAMSALIGGAYFNVRDILLRASGEIVADSLTD